MKTVLLSAAALLMIGCCSSIPDPLKFGSDGAVRQSYAGVESARTVLSLPLPFGCEINLQCDDTVVIPVAPRAVSYPAAAPAATGPCDPATAATTTITYSSE